MEKIIHDPTVSWFPSPVILVSCSEKNIDNIITIAWTGVICSRPPQISISLRPATFSHGLILKSKEFVINIPQESMLDSVKKCGSISGRNFDKWKECHLTKKKGQIVNTPLIKECHINIECKVIKTLELGTHTMFIGEVLSIHTSPEITGNSCIKIPTLIYSPKGAQYGKVVKLDERMT